MSRSTQPVEFSTFVQGLITEASPLTFPPNATSDELNCVLNRDGSRSRRLGMDLESGGTLVDTGIDVNDTSTTVFSTFNWDNVGGSPDLSYLVVQVGESLLFYDITSSPYSSNLVHTEPGVCQERQRASFSSVDGILVVATGNKKIVSFVYDEGTLTKETSTLYIRDTFGVEAYDGADELTDPQNATLRPTTLSNEHLYNLRNQSWGFCWPVVEGGKSGQEFQDPIFMFYEESDEDVEEGEAKRFPSNADSVIEHLHNDPNKSPYQLYYTQDKHHLSQLPSTPAPRGAFIIDALDRGASRLSEVQKLANTPQGKFFEYSVTDLPEDSTSGGAKYVVESAGRLFYAGFSGDTKGGDKKSPKLSSYVLFSRVIRDTSDIGTCFQEGDPTSLDDPDVLATDGGFLRLAGCYGVNGLVNLNEGVVVLAENGIWYIRGGSDFGFAADNFQQVKVSNFGCVSPKSIVEVGNSILFWGEDGIYEISPTEAGNLTVSNISSARIEKFYNNISALDKANAVGRYDPVAREVRWLYGNHLRCDTDCGRELILDQDLSAFYTSAISELDANSPKVLDMFEVPSFVLGTGEEDVTVGGVQVTVAGADVFVGITVAESSRSSTYYLAATQTAPTIELGFALYSDTEFTDWKTVDGTGKDAAAYAITGAFTGQETQRRKQVKYLLVHALRTEDGFELDGGGDIVPKNQSSIKIQARWDWSNSANSNKWGTEFQAYRYKRHYFPTDVNDPYDYGYETIVTRNKLRGRGRSLSLKFSTEPKKDFKLLGWAFDMGVNSDP